MAGHKLDPEILAHLEWIGFVRPTGLVVSAPALVRAGAILDRRDTEGQRLLRGCVEERVLDPKEDPVPHLPDFRAFAASVLGWSFSPKGYAGTAESPISPELEAPLPDYGETLRPDFAVRELEPKEGAPAWQLLVRVLEPGEDFDRVVREGARLEASPHGRMERLLRQTGVPAGLLCNGRALRLISAPRGESSGWLDFRVADMVQTAGRPISTALRLLLSQPRLLSLPRAQRFSTLLEDSRKFQNEVSERLAQQVLHALYELLRGFQAAHDASKGELLRQPLAEHPDEVYRAMLTVILRLVFLLYAEERDMLPEDETFMRYYSLAGLYERLREDAALFPDTMDQRYGAWAQLMVLFRMIHDGADSGAMRLPKRHGVLFDPDRYKFLEGRPVGGARQIHERIEPPLVPDGTIYRALEKLLVLDGERISYRALDVEQIGSVYETMMGFRLETTTGRSVAIKAQKKHGAPTAVDLDALLHEPAIKREKWLQDHADRQLTDTLKKATASAAALEDLHAALLPMIDPAATPDLVPKGAMVLQPSEERRRSGSHYTPRALTEPIVRTTLEPILARLRGADGRPPRPEQILDLKVCDPAMGSGAFLVEACRQLGDALVEAWHVHGEAPAIPPDEDEVIFARRLIAQRCLYGVDRNPVAVDLAKVSLWLVTLAKDHALTFVDHALRHGDSLVGLSREQIEAFHWDPDAPRFQAGFETMRVREHIAKVGELRRRIREADESVPDRELRDVWDEAQFELGKVRLFGDLVLAGYFEGENPKDRERKRSEYVSAVVDGEADRYRGWLDEWRHADQPLAPFHWEIEFPEVFERVNPGFDAIVGNPPFLGGLKLETAFGRGWRTFVVSSIAGNIRGVRGTADLCAYFLLRSAQLAREAVGCIGTLATNTVSEGDTSEVGLQRLVHSGLLIYAAERNFRWPGTANVRAAKVWLTKQSIEPPFLLDGELVPAINAQLRASMLSAMTPQRLVANSGLSFVGSIVLGDGFILDPQERDELVKAEPRSEELLRQYLNGTDLNTQPDMNPTRWALNFRDWPLSRQTAPADYTGPVAADFPLSLSRVEERVRRERESKAPTNSWNKKVREFWWHFGQYRWALEQASSTLRYVIVVARTSRTLAFARLENRFLFSDAVYVFASDRWELLSVLQSDAHLLWAQRFSSTLKGDLRYTNSGAFETFPLPTSWDANAVLESAGREYQLHRSRVQQDAGQGLTAIYNRFHDPEERDPEIVKLRVLHAAMNRVVLDAYGWSEIPADSEFVLDHEVSEEEWGEKKPWRYRWPEKVRQVVLGRLLALNGDRAKEEARSGAAATKKRGGKAVAKRVHKGPKTGDLFS